MEGNMGKVLIIGGGAAGMAAAIAAAEHGEEVHVFEKNEKLGKKLYITGKGRCNFTNACDMEKLLESVCTNRKFLYSAFYCLTNQDVIEFFENHGMRTKVERGGRVFPLSDKSTDVIDTLREAMKRSGVKIHLNSPVQKILLENTKSSGEKGDPEREKQEEEARVSGIVLQNGDVVKGNRVIVATGGIAYPSTGSTGDGYRFARECGHSVTELSPSLVPFQTKEPYARQMQGLSLKNVELSIYDGKKCLFREFGEMMFTHFGVTGPLVLTASTVVSERLRRQGSLRMEINLKPALTEEQLDARLLREFDIGKKKQFKNILGGLLPAKMIPVMIFLSGIDPDRKVLEITREERQRLLGLILHFPLTAEGLRDYNEAIVTRGGVSVKEVCPATMESRKVHNLYFAGEVLDLDAVTGGFNLQIAWSTGYAAGCAG